MQPCVTDTRALFQRIVTAFVKDKKSVESACLCLSRLVESFYTDERILKEIAANGLLTNLQQMVSIICEMLHLILVVMQFCTI